MQNLAKAERERKLAELKNFGATFKIPKSANPSPNPKSATVQPAPGAPSAQPTPKPAAAQAQPTSAPTQKPRIKMVLPEIPPFQPRKTSAAASNTKPGLVTIEKTANVTVPLVKAAEAATQESALKSGESSVVTSPKESAAKLNPGASTFVFKPNPAAGEFRPGGGGAAASISSMAAVGPTPPTAAPSDARISPSVTSVVNSPAAAPMQVHHRNPFFGEHMPKRQGPVNVREDFNPFKGKVSEAKNIRESCSSMSYCAAH